MTSANTMRKQAIFNRAWGGGLMHGFPVPADFPGCHPHCINFDQLKTPRSLPMSLRYNEVSQ